MTIDNRTLSMVVPYLLHNNEDENLFIKILARNISQKPLISFNLNIIQCLNSQLFNWTSVESSLTLRGEFVRTTFIDTNIMYLSSGITYLRNLTSIDCLTKTIYRTNHNELFKINLKIESTLNNYCSNENLCYPLNIYQCDLERHRCICRSPFQSYLTKNQQSICIHAVENIDQCTMKNLHCLEWCHHNRSSTMCICPNKLSNKKFLDDNRAYCEGLTNGLCNSFIQCPLGDICVDETCQNINYKLHHFMSFDIVTISIIVSSLILFVIVIILGICICILRRQRWKKHYHSSSDSVYKKKQQINIPTTSNYDNIIYGVFHNNVQLSSNLLSSNDDHVNDTSSFTTTDLSSYHPKIVFLGGEQQLTAIYA
ncbi:unnamed protein product [Rotaria sordida]|uniref:Uncharacterized protein n=1 Tax=Rotaria sordida TaxID=392033 RepID=A0A813X2Z8_9BILA|nr:unnamed protein product [Rotaria sordida]CAF0918956.1 unnamed protein product [Rotaria sordida]